MPLAAKSFLILGGINAALAVLLGAFGAHALKARMTTEMFAVYQTGVFYHLWHALGLLVVGIVGTLLSDSAYLKWAGWLMCAGIALFCGSLYLLSLTGVHGWGIVTPFGGVAFIAAWIVFVVAVLKTS